MKTLSYINFALSFSAVAGIDTRESRLWAVIAVAIWFFVSAYWASHNYKKLIHK